MTAIDHLSLELELTKLNSDGLIIKLEQICNIFCLSLFEANIQKSYLNMFD